MSSPPPPARRTAIPAAPPQDATARSAALSALCTAYARAVASAPGAVPADDLTARLDGCLAQLDELAQLLPKPESKVSESQVATVNASLDSAVKALGAVEEVVSALEKSMRQLEDRMTVAEQSHSKGHQAFRFMQEKFSQMVPLQQLSLSQQQQQQQQREKEPSTTAQEEQQEREAQIGSSPTPAVHIPDTRALFAQLRSAQ